MTSPLFRLVRSALLTGGALAGVSVSAWAQQPPPATVLARVVAIAPLMQQVPVQVCDPAAAAPTGGGAALGAIAGGAIGSQFGRGSGHVAGAVLGALGGAITGNIIEAQNRAAMGAGCGVQYQNQVTGYDVRYEWNGQRYHTRMPTDPGQWVRVATPVSDASYVEPGYPPDGYANTAPPPQSPGAAYPYPNAAPPAPPVAVGTQVTPPPGGDGAYPAYPAAAYPPPVQQPVYPAAPYAQPVYPVGVYPAPAPVVVRPAPVYVAPPVGVSIGVGGGGHRGGWGVGVGF